MWNRPAATAEPVLPPVTQASQSPSATAMAARTIDASGVARTALAGSGALAIETGASITSTPSATSPIASAGPNSTGVTPRAAAIAAPAATSAGPRSAPFASTAIRMTREPVPPALVVVLVAELGSHDLAATVRPAHRADAVRPARAVALRAAVVRRRLQLVLRAALVRAAVRLLLLWDGHGERGRLARGVGPQAGQHDLQIALPADRRRPIVLGRRGPGQPAHQAGDVVGGEVRPHRALGLGVGDELGGELREAHLLGRGVAEVGVLVHRLGDGAILVGDDAAAMAQEPAEPVPGVGVLERLAGDVGEPGEALVGQRGEELLLAREVAIDGAHADARGMRDALHVDVEPTLGELLASRSQDQLPVATSVCALCGDRHRQTEFRFRIVSTRNRNSDSDYTPPGQREPTMMTTAQEFERRRWTALVLLCLSQFIVVLDASIVNVALPSIGKGLHFSEESLPWVVNAYVLTFGGFLLLGGRM